MSEESDYATADHAAAEGALGHQATTVQKAAQDVSTLAAAQAVTDRKASSDEQAILIAAVEGLAAEARRVASTVITADAKSDRVRRWNRFWAALAVAVVVSLSGLELAGLVQAHAGNQRIASCTVPTGACYKDSHRQTANAIAELNRAAVDRQQTIERTTVAAVDCANKVAGLVAVQACVDKAMGGGGH